MKPAAAILFLVLVACTTTAPRTANLTGCVEAQCRLCYCGTPPLGECLPAGLAADRTECAGCQEQPGWCGCRDGGCALFGQPPLQKDLPPPPDPNAIAVRPAAPPPRPVPPPPEPPPALPAEPPDTCAADADCHAATAGANPVLAKAAQYAALRDGAQTLRVLVACANTDYLAKYGQAQRLFVAGPDFQLEAPACRCLSGRCAIAK